MCGITGIVNQSNNPVDLEELRSANDLVSHRGPDGNGIYRDTNFALGHRRLAVIDLSEKGKQPMEYRGNIIIYNGEIYNYLELKEELKKWGYAFRSETDTEVILAAYDYWGEGCVNHFNGMWAFAIFDKKKNRLFCSRDRFGIKPFYYTLIDDKFCFASEIKQFTAITGWEAKMNQTRAYEFLVFGYHDHTNETFFKGVFQLKKGHNLVYNLDDHTFSFNCYYKLPITFNTQISFNGAKEKFRKLFIDSIRLRLRSDVKVGSALSGGLDSSSVVGVINQILKGENKTKKQEAVSACFPGFEKDESLWIDEVVNKNRIKSHKVFPSFETLFDDLKRITWHQDEPIVGAGVIAQYHVFKTAKENGIKVMLDGQGADEILAGYEKFYLPNFKTLLKENPFRAILELFQFFKIHNIGPLAAFKAVDSFFKKKKKIKPDWLSSSFKIPAEELFIRSTDDTVQNTSINLLYEMGLSILLHYEDRNSLASSVESRLPFLDYRLVEFCLSLPDFFKINKAKRKYILRESMKKSLPEAVYKRFDKLGFATPQELWMKQFKTVFDEELKKAIKTSNGIINDKILESEDIDLVWRVIAFGKWVEAFNVAV